MEITKSKTIRLWDIENGRCIQTIEGNIGGAWNVKVTFDGKRVISDSHHDIRVWAVEEGSCLKVLRGHSDSVRSISITGNGELAISGSNDHTIECSI